MHDQKDVRLPTKLPEPGFYYHYKHDPDLIREDCPDAGLRNYAHEVMPHFGLYTEEEGPDDKFRVSYLPLYPWSPAYEITLRAGRICEDHRPLSMFLEDVETDTYSGPRFRKVTDPVIIEQLKKVADQMYGNFPLL